MIYVQNSDHLRATLRPQNAGQASNAVVRVFQLYGGTRHVLEPSRELLQEPSPFLPQSLQMIGA
jgi:hypothetical protein